MKAFRQTLLTTSESTDVLKFRVTQKHGWGDVCIWLTCAAFAVWWGLHNNDWLVLLVVTVIIFLAEWFYDPTAELTVTEYSLTVNGPTLQSVSRQYRIWARDIVLLEYGTGGEGEPSGLYVKHGPMNYTCVLPRISQEQTQVVIDTILRHFPEFVYGDRDPYSLLFGKNSDPVTLGLSRPE